MYQKTEEPGNSGREQAPRKKKRGRPQAIALRSQSSRNDFAYLQKHFPAAWYISPLIGGALASPCLGVVVQKDIPYQGAEGAFILRRGGILLQRSDKLVQAVQPEFFKSKFVRCFSDGTRICNTNEEEMTQAVVLSESNAQLRKKFEQNHAVSAWKSLLYFWSINKNSRKMKKWNEEIQAHVSDLALRHKLGQD